jgi:hypothetical protein
MGSNVYIERWSQSLACPKVRSNKVVAVIVGLGAQEFVVAALRLKESAILSGWFDAVEFFDDSRCKCLIERYSSIISENPRGYGAFFWKPHIVNKVLNEYNDDDIIVYIDGGCEISLAGGVRFNQLIDTVVRVGNIFFETPHKANDFVRNDLRKLIDSKNWDDVNIQAGYFYIKNNECNKKIVKIWSRLATIKNGYYIKDFGECNHRHDQTLLNYIFKSRRSWFNTLPAEDSFSRWRYYKWSWVNLFPIHTLRSRRKRFINYETAEKFIPQYLISNAFLFYYIVFAKQVFFSIVRVGVVWLGKMLR